MTVLGCASLYSLALIAAGFCKPQAGSGGAERTRGGAAGALDASDGEPIIPAGATGAYLRSAVFEEARAFNWSTGWP